MNINYNWYLKILPSSNSSYNNLGGSAARKGDGVHHKVLWVISITLFELSFGGSPGYAMIGDGLMTYSCEMGRWRESRATYSCPVARGIIYAYTPCENLNLANQNSRRRRLSDRRLKDFLLFFLFFYEYQ